MSTDEQHNGTDNQSQTLEEFEAALGKYYSIKSLTQRHRENQ